MRIFAFSDLHANVPAAERIVARSHAAEAIIGAGDFANARRQLERCISVLRNIKKPAILVPGNNESTEELVTACQSWPEARVLHGTSIEINGVVFFGLGGGVPITPFGPWSYDLSEERAAEMLASCPDGCVVVSHSPPKGTLDLSSAGQSLGSTAVRETVLRCRPPLVVCGHIHASGGRIERVGPTTVINAGPDGIEWELMLK